MDSGAVLMQKTFKRETAGVLLLALAALGGWSVSNPDALPVFEASVLPVILFAMGAFGLDTVAKQINIR